jgi:hypothetical protein
MESKFTYRNFGGITRTMIVDEERPFSPVVHTEVDIGDTLEQIKYDRENHRPGGDFKHVAKVPMTVYELSVEQGWDEDDWRRWLNDPNNEAFRVWKGRV